MSDNSIRITTTPNGSDKYIKVKLEQDFDFIEVLSLKITQEESYRNFCSDYGVVAGRAIINSGFGVPNAKVSIFIPIDDIDNQNEELKGLYPYNVITDKDSDGIRYNLLPRNSETDNDCFTPVGTFPNKREILDNPDLMDVYCKYYKFTTTTNHAGDFMFFGVPLGTYTLHIDADISDIGIASQRPYDSISQGTPTKMFESPTKYKGGTNLDKLIQIKSLNVGVNVQPFWGDTENCEIGITRVDVDFNYDIIPSAIFMGSIFGDQDKDSINKRCRPRRKMGRLCSQVPNEGTIEMIRETLDGDIESFDIEGGRLIDENGAWAYQIPMNLDYMITDEYGNLVLSEDPSKGVPTRASVRFKMSMDETGGEGRLRTKAKYLVPNNPTNQNEIDYEFGPDTKKTSFRTMYWNKIYSVSNYISRFQTISSPNTRNMTGIKDVDDCAGDKTPFPYNRVNTSFSPIFFIICLIIKIIGFIVYIMNALLIPIINLIVMIVNVIIGVLRSIMGAFCSVANWKVLGVRIFGFLRFTCKLRDSLTPIDYVPCMFVRCPGDDDPALSMFAPGCKSSSYGFQALSDTQGAPSYYDGDSFGHGGFADLCGLDDCIAFQMARSLSIFQFDFYNDWVNGALYSFLLKYKKKNNGRERFCEYDCDDFGIDSGGVDGNKDGQSDNYCYTNHLLDVCFDGGGDSQNEARQGPAIREGLIKKYNGELFYAATTHNASTKLFATDIINLGAVFKCDWQGVPKIQESLIPTSYKIAPDAQELDNDKVTVLTTGLCGLDGNTTGIFFSINCLGLHVNYTQCLNIRQQCEFGVELDEFRDITNITDAIIGAKELDSDDADRPKLFRDVFLGLNRTTNSWSLNLPYASNFNLGNVGGFNYTSPAQNGADYLDFRGVSNNQSFTQPKHSFYFYFGILPGKTALEKMNQKFFTKCALNTTEGFNIVIKTNAVIYGSLNSGSVVITVSGGDGPFTYTVSGPNGYTNSGSLGVGNTVPTTTVTGLVSGTYTITVYDVNNNPITQSFQISLPQSLYADAFVSNDCTTANTPNGSITIGSTGGGSGTYSYTLYNSGGAIVSGPSSFTAPHTINGLVVDIASNGAILPNPVYYGYSLEITDSAGDIVTLNNLIVNGTTPLVVNPTKTDILCFGSDNGSIQLNVTGGKQPYSSNTTSLGFSNNTLNLTNLSAGTYTTVVTDSLGAQQSVTTNILSISPFMEIEKADSLILLKQCDPLNYTITIFVTSQWSGPIYLDYNKDLEQDTNGDFIFHPLINNGTISFPNNNYVSSTTPVVFQVPNNFFIDNLKIRMSNSNYTCHSEELDFSTDEMPLPISTLVVTPADNTKQCTVNQVKFKFNISHLLLGVTNKAPYLATFTIKSINSLGNVTSGVFTEVITSNQQIITKPTQTIGGLPASSCIITVSVTDNGGCISPSLQLPTILLPTSSLTAGWQNTPYYNNVAGQQYVHKRLQANGGIGTKTGSPYQVDNGTAVTVYNYPLGSTLTSTVTDSVGCSLIITG